MSALLLVIALPSVASADTTTTAQRNAISWTWTYNASGNPVYNCLAYALGYTDRWVWPLSWGSSPSVQTVDTYMYNLGHGSTSKSSAKIICYGQNNAVTHFSKVTSSTTCRAKWGRCERFNHGAWAPYYVSAASYGTIYRYYK